MEPRARTRTLLRRAGISAALAALLLPAAAGTAAAKTKHKTPQPTISSIKPRSLAVGETLTIRGRNFVRGRNKNSVAFKRAGGATIYVKASKSTTKMMQVTLPARLEKLLLVRNGVTVVTQLKLRILAKRFGKSFTSGTTAPMVFPAAPTTTGGGSTPGGTPGSTGGSTTPAADAPSGDCDGDGIINAKDTDDDNDLLPDTLEKSLGTDPCKYDTDGDGVSDGYEYQSAVDLNNNGYISVPTVTPAPYKLPYPNALYPDANVDYDGDSLTLGQEFSLWKASRDPSKGLDDLSYSDGNQYSAYKRDAAGKRPGSLVGPDPEDKYRDFIAWAQGAGAWNVLVPIASSIDGAPSLTTVQLNDFNLDGAIRTTYDTANHIPSESRWYDFDGDGKLSDDERDEDADGLSNYDEASGRLQPGFWTSCYSQEKPYTVSYSGTSMTDADTDGDGVRDGADDQDHDDIPNLMEMSRIAVTYGVRGYDGGCGSSVQTASADPAKGFVNPFNPCLPYVYSRTCSRHPGFGGLPAPFDATTKIYQVFN